MIIIAVVCVVVGTAVGYPMIDHLRDGMEIKNVIQEAILDNIEESMNEP